MGVETINCGNILVAVRIRPLSNKEKKAGNKSCCEVDGDQVVTLSKFGIPGTIIIVILSPKAGKLNHNAGRHLRSQKSCSSEFAFDAVFGPEAPQSTIYIKTVKPIISTILKGYNATVFAYGATGAGKTHTMMGSERDGLTVMENADGIIPHSLHDIFAYIDQEKQNDTIHTKTVGSVASAWTVMVSYLEVYNEQIHDLLYPSTKNLALREDPAHGIVHVAGLRSEIVSTSEEVMDLLRRGNRNRKTESTAANSVSSRSHAVLQLTVRHNSSTISGDIQAQKSTREGKLSLIDLAGSERASLTQNRGIRLTEGASINKSLLALANCINALALTSSQSRCSDGGDHPKPKVQYRDSKLTHLLKSSLEGDCRLVMIANINPSNTCCEESLTTLKYANRAKNIKVRPKMHVVTADMTHKQRADQLEQDNVKLRHQIAELEKYFVNNIDQNKRKDIPSLNHPCLSSKKSKLEDHCDDIDDEKRHLLQKNRELEKKITLLERQLHINHPQDKTIHHSGIENHPQCTVKTSASLPVVTRPSNSHRKSLIPKPNLSNDIKSFHPSRESAAKRRQSMIPQPLKVIENDRKNDPQSILRTKTVQSYGVVRKKLGEITNQLSY